MNGEGINLVKELYRQYWLEQYDAWRFACHMQMTGYCDYDIALDQKVPERKRWSPRKRRYDYPS